MKSRINNNYKEYMQILFNRFPGIGCGRHQELFCARYFKGLPLVEIALLYGISRTSTCEIIYSYERRLKIKDKVLLKQADIKRDVANRYAAKSYD